MVALWNVLRRSPAIQKHWNLTARLSSFHEQNIFIAVFVIVKITNENKLLWPNLGKTSERQNNSHKYSLLKPNSSEATEQELCSYR